jgi:chromosome segregation ATPase
MILHGAARALRLQAARIVELEAERNQIDQMYRAQAKVSGDLNTGLINAAARIAKLEVDYARAEKVAVSLHAITKKAMDRIAELEAERDKLKTASSPKRMTAMIGIDKTDQWDEENAGKPLPPTYTQLEARIAELEAERRDYITETEALVIRVRRENAIRIAELEAELAEITRRAVDDGAHDAIDASARMAEREAMLALLDGMPDALARDIAATIRAMDEEPLPNRLAELEAANAICRTDIAALMTSCDKLEARNTELEAEIARLNATPANRGDMSDDATLVERLRERSKSYMIGGPSSSHTSAMLDEAAARVAELEAERSDYITETEALVIRVRGENAARIAELEAEIAQRDSSWASHLAGDLIAAGESAPDPRAIPRLNIKLEYRGGGISGTRSLDVIRVEAEDDGSFTAVSDYWPPA